MSVQVSYTRLFEKQLAKCPSSIQQKAILWVQTIECFGMGEVRKRPSYRDKPLRGDRKGQRSIRLSRGYRLIYCELRREIRIKLLEVHKHDY